MVATELAFFSQLFRLIRPTIREVRVKYFRQFHEIRVEFQGFQVLVSLSEKVADDGE